MNKAFFTAAALGAMALGGAGFSALQGCSVSTSNGGTNFDFDSGDTTPNPTSGDDSGTTTTDTDGGVSCAECLYESCSTQNANCFANAECTALYQCAINPPSGMTADSCVTAHPNGACLYEQLSVCDNVAACNTSVCNTACAGTSEAMSCPANTNTDDCVATAADGGTSTDTDATAPAVNDAGQDVCSACTTAACPSQQTACASGTDCDNYNKCAIAATDATALATCATMYSAGATASQALAACSASNCASQCGN